MEIRGLIWNFNFPARVNCEIARRKIYFSSFFETLTQLNDQVWEGVNNIIRSTWIIDNRFYHAKKHLVRDNYRCTIETISFGQILILKQRPMAQFSLARSPQVLWRGKEWPRPTTNPCSNHLLTYTRGKTDALPTIFLRNFLSHLPTLFFVLTLSSRRKSISFLFFFFEEEGSDQLMIPPRIFRH